LGLIRIICLAERERERESTPSRASWVHSAALTSISLALSRTPAETARLRKRDSASHGMPVKDATFCSRFLQLPTVFSIAYTRQFRIKLHCVREK